MNIKLNILFVFIVCVFVTNAQTIKFNYQYPNNGGSLSTNLINISNKYYMLGISGNTQTNQYQGLAYLRTDENGISEYSKEIFHPNGNGFTSNCNSNMFTNQFNKYVLFNGVIQIGTDHYRATLVKFNLITGDTLWLKTYSQPGDSTQLFTSTTLADSSIIVLGYKYYIVGNNHYSKPFIMRVDKNGNYKWHKYIDTNFSLTNYYYQKIIKINDNDFIVLGNKYSSICYPQAFSMRVDTNGVKQYEVNFTGIQYPVVNDAIVLQDGSILAVGGYVAVSNCSAVSDKYKKFAYKINPANGGKIISKTYNHQSNATNATSVQQKTNGLILIGGATTNESTVNSYNYNADILTLNNNLDSLNTIFIDNAGVGFSQNTNQLILTPDGGFAAAIASYPNAGQQKFWLVKADSNGCYTSTCSSVGIKELEKLNDKFKIYPNPANEVINVELGMLASTGSATNYKIEITNTLGRTIQEAEIKTKQITIDLKELNSGLYFIKLFEKQKLISTYKFIKQ